MQKWANFAKIDAFSSWNMDLTHLETLFRGVIHILQRH